MHQFHLAGDPSQHGGPVPYTIGPLCGWEEGLRFSRTKRTDSTWTDLALRHSSRSGNAEAVTVLRPQTRETIVEYSL